MWSAAQICSRRWGRISDWLSWKRRSVTLRWLDVGSKFQNRSIIYTTVGFIVIQCETAADLWGRFVLLCGDLMLFKFWSGFHLLTLWKLFVALERSGMRWVFLMWFFFSPADVFSGEVTVWDLPYLKKKSKETISMIRNSFKVRRRIEIKFGFYMQSLFCNQTEQQRRKAAAGGSSMFNSCEILSCSNI